VTATGVSGISEQEIGTVVEGTMDVDTSEIIAGGVVDGGMISTDTIIPMGGVMGPPPSHIGHHQEVEVSTEDQLKSSERLDRSSPDLWPQNCKFL
jgi:hypothetical protein